MVLYCFNGYQGLKERELTLLITREHHSVDYSLGYGLIHTLFQFFFSLSATLVVWRISRKILFVSISVVMTQFWLVFYLLSQSK